MGPPETKRDTAAEGLGRAIAERQESNSFALLLEVGLLRFYPRALQQRTIFRRRIHSSPHKGLLKAAEENIKLKLTLTRLPPPALASTECCRYEGKTSSVPFLTLTTT